MLPSFQARTRDTLRDATARSKYSIRPKAAPQIEYRPAIGPDEPHFVPHVSLVETLQVP
jgi:hypothetical protein